MSKIIDAKIVEVRLTVVDQLPNGAYREIVDLRLGTHRDKKGLVVAHFSLERKLAAAATISLIIDQERNLPGGTWYVFGLDDFLDLFNDLPAWKLRQKLRVREYGAATRAAVFGAAEGTAGQQGTRTQSAANFQRQMMSLVSFENRSVVPCAFQSSIRRC